MRRLIVPLLWALVSTASCSSTIWRRNPTGEIFPSVRGAALDGKAWRIPEDLRGQPALLLVGYKQDSQFDIDRWLLGIEQLGLAVKALELPTISGMVPRMFSTSIDKGMRSGIPKPIWGGVITVYKDAEAIERFTGTANKLPARVLLLDKGGKVVFFHDEGFSVQALKALQAALGRTAAP